MNTETKAMDLMRDLAHVNHRLTETPKGIRGWMLRCTKKRLVRAVNKIATTEDAETAWELFFGWSLAAAPIPIATAEYIELVAAVRKVEYAGALWERWTIHPETLRRLYVGQPHYGCTEEDQERTRQVMAYLPNPGGFQPNGTMIHPYIRHLWETQKIPAHILTNTHTLQALWAAES